MPRNTSIVMPRHSSIVMALVLVAGLFSSTLTFGFLLTLLGSR